MEDETTVTNADLQYAVQLVHATCCLAGSASYLDDLRADLRDCGIIRAIKDHDTPALFDWLVGMLSYQGISDSVAAGYIAQHGNARWADVAEGLSRTPSCPKLIGYWRFTDCRYHKGSGTCAEPGHIDACPLPRHPLRNGRLNQMAYSLFLFMRDVADADSSGGLIGNWMPWIPKRQTGSLPCAKPSSARSGTCMALIASKSANAMALHSLLARTRCVIVSSSEFARRDRCKVLCTIGFASPPEAH